jgi:hypothetical protein
MWKAREHTQFLVIHELIEADGTNVGNDRGCSVCTVDLDEDALEHTLLDPS